MDLKRVIYELCHELIYFYESGNIEHINWLKQILTNHLNDNTLNINNNQNENENDSVGEPYNLCTLLEIIDDLNNIDDNTNSVCIYAIEVCRELYEMY